MSQGDSGKRDESIFEILDGMMFQLSRTKKMFMVMILTTLIIPPIALLVMTATFDQPFNERLEMRLQKQLELGEITKNELDRIREKIADGDKKNLFFLYPPQIVIFVISLGWLGVGVRQWLVLSKWDKKYQKFKQRQDEIDKKLENDDQNDSEDDSDIK